MFCDSNDAEETVIELANLAEKEYDFAVVMTEDIYKVKKEFSAAKYKVEALLPAPVADNLEEMPKQFKEKYLVAVREAGAAVSASRKFTNDILSKYFDIDDTASTIESLFGEPIDKVETPSIKRIKGGHGPAVSDVIKSKLKVSCESYERARYILIQEIKKHERMMEMIIKDALPCEDKVLFNVRGELMTYSKVSLVNKTKNTDNRTYFDGLLNSANWKSDAVGAYGIDDEPRIFRLIIACIADRKSFNKQFRKLDSTTRDHLTSRLDYYQISIATQYRANPSMTVVDNYTNLRITHNSNDECCGIVLDASIKKYTVTVDKSENMNIMIGFTQSKYFNVSDINSESCGWYVYLNDGTLFSQDGDSGKEYAYQYDEGDIITCVYSASSNQISFMLNEEPLEVAFRNVKGKHIAPAVELREFGDAVTLSFVE